MNKEYNPGWETSLTPSSHFTKGTAEENAKQNGLVNRQKMGVLSTQMQGEQTIQESVWMYMQPLPTYRSKGTPSCRSPIIGISRPLGLCRMAQHEGLQVLLTKADNGKGWRMIDTFNPSQLWKVLPLSLPDHFLLFSPSL